MQISLQPVSETQLPQLLPMIEAYHRFEELQSTHQQRESAVKRLITEPGLGGIWLIEVEGEAAGYIVLCKGFSIEFSGFDAFVDEFFIDPAYRCKGVGREALALIREQAKALDIQALHLEVARSNGHAKRLYRGAGFEVRDKYQLMSSKV